MRCGSCKQDHPTVREVRECYGTTQPSIFQASAGNGGTGWLTEKQAKLIRTLIEEQYSGDELAALQRGLYATLDPMDPEKAMSRRDASALIDGLIKSRPAPHMRDPEAPGRQDDVEVVHRSIPDGTYTVVRSMSGDEDYITIRLRCATGWATDLPDGSQVAEFLSGPDNENDYTGFAFVVKGKPRVWKRYRDEGRPVSALHTLLDLSDEGVQQAGYEYALRSSRCYRCNRTLTVPASIHRGLGPVCAGVLKEGGS